MKVPGSLGIPLPLPIPEAEVWLRAWCAAVSGNPRAMSLADAPDVAELCLNDFKKRFGQKAAP